MAVAQHGQQQLSPSAAATCLLSVAAAGGSPDEATLAALLAQSAAGLALLEQQELLQLGRLAAAAGPGVPAAWRPAFFAALLEALPELPLMQLPELAELLAELQPQVGIHRPWHCVPSCCSACTAALLFPAALAVHSIRLCTGARPQWPSQLAITPSCTLAGGAAAAGPWRRGARDAAA